jgi:hypothetical protein
MHMILVFNQERTSSCITMAFWDAWFSKRDSRIQIIHIFIHELAFFIF